MNGPVIELDSVTKRFGETIAVCDLSLSVPAGAFLGLLGRNGAGKSTLIKMVTGLMRPTSGSIRVLGSGAVAEDPDVKRRIGVMPEGTALLERLTGPQYLQFAGRLYGLEDEVIEKRRAELFDVLELQPAPRTVIGDYSYGMKKKTALCAALLHGPRLLLLDEPFEGIDPVSTRTIKDLLLGLHRKGTTIVLTSHALDLVERLCPVLAILETGRLAGVGSLDDLRARHGDAESLEALFVRLAGGAQDGALSWS
jgi:ABC-2 type transport system ATP-binding protein